MAGNPGFLLCRNQATDQQSTIQVPAMHFLFLGTLPIFSRIQNTGLTKSG